MLNFYLLVIRGVLVARCWLVVSLPPVGASVGPGAIQIRIRIVVEVQHLRTDAISEFEVRHHTVKSLCQGFTNKHHGTRQDQTIVRTG